MVRISDRYLPSKFGTNRPTFTRRAELSRVLVVVETSGSRHSIRKVRITQSIVDFI